MIRPSGPGWVSLANVAIELGKPLWVDYDDDLLHVPASNPAHSFHEREDIRGNIAGFLKNASVVTVSTLALANSFARHLPRPARVIRNAWHTGLYREDPTPNCNNKTILWRGSATHDEDVMFHLPAIKAIHERHPTWTWYFAGHAYWGVKDVISKDRLKLLPPSDFVSYLRVMKNAVQPAVAIVPLKDNRFNRCKSNIAWLEGTYLGAAVVCPDMDEWQNPGAVLYDAADPMAMAAAFDRAIDNQADCVTKSWAAIKDGLTVERTNEARIEILNALVPG